MTSLVTPEQLAGILDGVTVLDVRYQLGRADGHEQFLSGHVPGAVYVDLSTDLADPPADPVDERGRHPLPSPERFAAAMARAGVRRERPVVVYDDWSSMAATRAWWLLTFHGHPDVRVLDGGWSWWTRTGAVIETGEPDFEQGVEQGDFRADPGHLPVVDADGAAQVARDGVLLDARAAERFRGEVEPVDPVAGHVPGAVNVPTALNHEDGRFRSLSELADLYAMVGEHGDVAAYCGSGVTATHDLFALHLLGRRAALFPASWSGWVSDDTRPVATDA
ncbi:MAG: sulfurtransferase [Nocardioidaceae bacterium]